jgi:hypothetical protein
MPRRSQDAALADLVTARYRAAAEQRIPRVDAWDRSYDNHDPAYINKTKVKSPPYVKFPYLHRVTTQQTALLMEANDANGRWLHALPTTQGTREGAEAVTEFLEVQYRQKAADFHLNNRTALKRAATMGLKYGNSFVLCQWERHPAWWGVRLVALDPYDVYLDASHGRFYIVRRVVTLAQLRDLAQGISAPLYEDGQDPDTGEPVQIELPPRDGGRALGAVRKVEREIRAGNAPTYVYDALSDAHGNSRRYTRNRVQGDGIELVDTYVAAADDPFNAPICVLEYYEAHGEGLIAKVIPAFDGGESLVFQSEQNPYGACPIAPFTPYPVDNEYYGLGNGEIVGPLSEVMDWALRGELAMIGATAWAPLLYKRSANLRKQYLKSIYGLAIQVGDASDLQWMQPPSSTGVHTLAHNVTQKAADFGTGESDVRRGDVGQSRSATASAIAETAGNTTDRNIYSQWRDTQEQIGYICLALAKVHVARTELIPILGRHTERFYKLKPEFLEGNWEVQFGGNPLGANTTQQIAATLNILQAGAPSGELDVREVLREVIMLTGKRDPDRFLLRKDPPPPLSVEDEHTALLRFGQMPQVSPQDNHLEHWEGHGQLLQQMPPNDPRAAALLLHTRVHGQLLQQQMAPQGQQGGGGPQALQPGQVGAPGQPATMQPSTIGVDQVRNGSNVAAGGQAPGPTGSVPGRAIGGVVQGALAPRR